MKKPSLKTLKKKLDTAWSIAVRVRDGNRCVVCGKKDGLSAHHWIVRRARSLATRWNVDNGATLCYHCHLIQMHQQAVKDFHDRFYAIMENIVPRERQEAIKTISTVGYKPSLYDLELLLSALPKPIPFKSVEEF